MRYFIECSYNGARYAGWQRQPDDPTVQQTLEEAFSLILREEIAITGCGRTDADVHAQQYYFHLDTNQEFTPELLYRFNKFLPEDIGLHAVHTVPDNASARFDAVRRTYQYYLKFTKDVMSPGLALWYPHKDNLNFAAMQEVSNAITQYKEFKSFCKEGSDAKHYLCDVTQARWIFTERDAILTISANRFLRGMVRLIVGACLEVGQGKLTIEEIKTALDEQTPVPRAVSAPAHALHLVSVEYPAGLLTKLF